MQAYDFQIMLDFFTFNDKITYFKNISSPHPLPQILNHYKVESLQYSNPVGQVRLKTYYFVQNCIMCDVATGHYGLPTEQMIASFLYVAVVCKYSTTL